VSSFVTRLIHTRAFLSCQTSVFFFTPFDDLPFSLSLSLSLSLSPINDVFGDAYRWYRLSTGDTRTCQSRGTYEILEFTENVDRSRGWRRRAARRIVRYHLAISPKKREKKRVFTARKTRGVKMPLYDFSIGPDMVDITRGRADKNRKKRRGVRRTPEHHVLDLKKRARHPLSRARRENG